MEMCRYECSDGIFFRGIKDNRFKTACISVHIITPITKEDASANAIVPFMLLRSSKEYPDYTEFNKNLEYMYGAGISANVERNGGMQMLHISVSVISDKYTLDNEKLSLRAAKLLFSLFFDPLLDENGCFNSEGFEIEKRQTIEQIDSEFNDKRFYSRQKCFEYMLEGEIPCVSKFGQRDKTISLTAFDVTQAYKKLLKTARIEISAMGDCNTEEIYNLSKAYVSGVQREPVEFSFPIYGKNQSYKEIKDEMDVTQSKLVMGFRTGTNEFSEETYALRLMTALFGGTPSSKLFLNVREKQSLCYYCSSSFYSNIGAVIVDSGVESVNTIKAKEEILRQLEDIKCGNFTEDELTAAKLSLIDSYNTIFDYISGIESWYLYRTFQKVIETPEDTAKKISELTRDDIISAAKKLSLTTIYLLNGGKADE